MPRDHSRISIPSEALIFGAAGTQVAVVHSDGTVKLTSVRIARDRGAMLDLHEGLDGSEPIVLSPPADLQDGASVTSQPATPTQPSKLEAKAE